MKIYGHSDDCIEIEGRNINDEIYLMGEMLFLHFDGGVVIQCSFCLEEDECWRFRVVKNDAGVSFTENGPNEDDDYELVLNFEPTSFYATDSVEGVTASFARKCLKNNINWDNMSDDQVIDIYKYMISIWIRNL